MKKIFRAVAVLAVAWFAFGEPVVSAATFTWGPFLRVRHEYWNNIFDMNSDLKDTQNFYRFKISLWGQMDVSPDFSAYARLTNESKAYVMLYSNNNPGNAMYNIGEAVMDNLYVDWKNIAALPLSLRIGRQDFINTYGEGFLIMDGTPLDGSRTYYFNAAKATWKFNDQNSTDLLAIMDSKTDRFYVMNKQATPTPLNLTDETAYGLYHKYDPDKSLHVEGYYLWKNEDTKNPDSEVRLNTVGSFAKCIVDPWTLRGQLAYQFGTQGTGDRTGLGGYLFGDLNFKETVGTPMLSLGYIYLSGDDASTTDKVEGWDPLFSRWPWMSELYVLAYKSETSVGYWTNLNMWRAQAVINPLAKTKLTLSYNLMGANQPGSGAGMFGTGKDRGNLLQGRVDYTFTKNITTYAYVDYFTPGSFYFDGADPAIFTRVEVQFKY